MGMVGESEEKSSDKLSGMKEGIVTTKYTYPSKTLT